MKTLLVLIIGTALGFYLDRILKTPAVLLVIIASTMGSAAFRFFLSSTMDDTTKTMWAHAQLYAKGLHLRRSPVKCERCPSLPLQKQKLQV